jgi:hypothetical protein
LCLLRLEHLGIRTPFWRQRGGQARPPVPILGGDQGLWGHAEAIANLDLRCLRLRRTAAPCPFLGNTACFSPIG